MRIVKLISLITLMGSLNIACVTLPSSNSKYYNLSKNECQGQATLGKEFICVSGTWSKLQELNPQQIENALTLKTDANPVTIP